MSEMNKPVDKSGNPAPPLDNAPASGAPAVAGKVGEPQSTMADAGNQAVTASAATNPAPVALAPASITPPDPQELEAWNQQVRRRMRQKSRRSFLGWGAGLVAGVGAFRWLTTRRELDGVPWPMRKALETNEQLARDYLNTRRLAPTFDRDRLSADRVNGNFGLGDDMDAATWKLRVHGLASQDEPMMLGLDAIRNLPRVEMVTELKCIEGWSVVVQWAGARFTDFMKAYPPQTISGDPLNFDHPENLPPYVSMETPDGGYYVGLDMESALHPQTLLCYERNGEPLPPEHGAPLRLVIPVKYGVKNIKRLGTIRYSRRRPADYWAERGYDWYIGL